MTYCLYEARKPTGSARKHKVATQMGNQGHSGEGYRAVSEPGRAGATAGARRGRRRRGRHGGPHLLHARHKRQKPSGL